MKDADDLTIAYMVGYEKGKDETKEKAAKLCESEAVLFDIVGAYETANHCAKAIRGMM